MNRAAAAACASCLAALAQTAAARAAPIPLLSPNIFGPPPPPLSGGQQLTTEPGEVRIPGSLSNVESVRVGVAQDGSPVSVVVLQRMSIRGLGDFRFVVPAPARTVAEAAGSQSFPGLRQSGIVWQGFSPGRRLLAARITLQPGVAAAGLPLGLTITRDHGFTRVRVANRTAKQFTVVVGTAPMSKLQAALAQVRNGLGRQFAAGRPLLLQAQQVDGTVGAQKAIQVDAPLHVGGTISIARGRTARIDTALGGDRPAVRLVALRGEGRVTVALNVGFVRDRRTLLPTAAALAAARDPVLLLQTALARTAVALQYQQYLASPKPDGASSTTYRYRTARVVHASPAPPGAGGSGNGLGALAIALLAVGGLLGLGGLTVLWAHM